MYNLLIILQYLFSRHAIAINATVRRCDGATDEGVKEKRWGVGEFGKRLYICKSKEIYSMLTEKTTDHIIYSLMQQASLKPSAEKSRIGEVQEA